MRADQFDDFKADIKAGLNETLLSEVYDLTPEETKRGINHVNRAWIEQLYSGLIQFFRKIVFQAEMRIKVFKINQALREVKRNGK